MKATRLLVWTLVVVLGNARAEGPAPSALHPVAPTSTRLQIQPSSPASEQAPFPIPRPAHALPTLEASPSPSFRVSAARNPLPAPGQTPAASADYLLPDRDEKPAITPENSNLNLPTEMEIIAQDTGEKILLPAGTYRQILQLPIDSPLMQETARTRRNLSPAEEAVRPPSRYAEPERKPIWVRYESLEKIRIGDAERRGGIDLPSHGPVGLGPRVWYAKSETADLASSVFYFVFGGLGYSTANLLGWSAGNTREIPGDFEYRLIRR